jgi:hypothetical protein
MRKQGNRIGRDRCGSCFRASYEVYGIRVCPVTRAIGMRKMFTGLRLELEFVDDHINGHVQR